MILERDGELIVEIEEVGPIPGRRGGCGVDREGIHLREGW